MCEEYCGKVSWWLKENPEIPHSNDFPCSNPRCEVRFKMVLGIFYGDNVFCTSDCLKEWENHGAKFRGGMIG